MKSKEYSHFMVSVIVPYNTDRGYLKKCIDSIEAQTAPHELILSNSPGSLPYNFNAGLERARGEFVKIVHDDDWLPHDSLANLVNGIGAAPWVVANAIEVSGGVETIYKPESLDFGENVKLNRIHGGAVMYRTDVLRAVGGMDNRLWTGEEYEMHLRLMSRGYLPVYIDTEVHYQRAWIGQKSKIYRRDPSSRKIRENEIRKIQSLYSDKV